MRPMTGLNELREQAKMTRIEQGQGRVAAPEEMVTALSKDGVEGPDEVHHRESIT